MRIMAIDYGDARIGLAVSDPTGLICGEAWTMEEWNMERAAARICEEAAKRGAEKLVLGLPKNMDGSEGPRAEKSREFKKMLEENGGCSRGEPDTRGISWQRALKARTAPRKTARQRQKAAAA